MPSIALGGIASAYIDGNAVKLVGSLTYQTSTLEREAAMGMDGFHGFNAKYMPGFISMKVRVTSDQPLSNYDDMESVSVQIQLNNGTSVSGYNMYIAKAAEADGAESAADLRFEGALVSVS